MAPTLPPAAAVGPWLPLPTELTHLIVHNFLDVPDLLNLTSLSRGVCASLDEDRALWQAWFKRRYCPVLGYLSRPSLSYPDRVHVATCNRLRHQLFTVEMQPLADGTPVLIASYFRVFDLVRDLGASDLVDRALQQLLLLRDHQHHQPFMPQGGGGLLSHQRGPAMVASVEASLALHLLYRKTREGAVLGPWARGALTRLAEGPHVGTLVVAYWVLGSHNPYGFRARDVLKTERVDLRDLAGLILDTDQAWRQGQGLKVGEDAAAVAGQPAGGGPARPGVHALQRLELLRGMRPPVSLDPATTYVIMEDG